MLTPLKVSGTNDGSISTMAGIVQVVPHGLGANVGEGIEDDVRLVELDDDLLEITRDVAVKVADTLAGEVLELAEALVSALVLLEIATELEAPVSVGMAVVTELVAPVWDVMSVVTELEAPVWDGMAVVTELVDPVAVGMTVVKELVDPVWAVAAVPAVSVVKAVAVVPAVVPVVSVCTDTVEFDPNEPKEATKLLRTLSINAKSLLSPSLKNSF
jgi:hypothetical protein